MQIFLVHQASLESDDEESCWIYRERCSAAYPNDVNRCAGDGTGKARSERR